jgi:hypothetical protein
MPRWPSRVPGGLRRLPEVELRVRVLRIQAHDPLVDDLGLVVVVLLLLVEVGELGVVQLGQVLEDDVRAHDRLLVLLQAAATDDRREGVFLRLQLSSGDGVLQPRPQCRVQPRERGERVGVLRPQLRISGESRGRSTQIALRLQCAGEVLVRRGILWVLLDPVSRLRLGRRAAGAAVVVEDVEEAEAAAGADAEDDEPDGENDREQQEHPLRLPAKLRKEHGLLCDASRGCRLCAPTTAGCLRLSTLASSLSGSAGHSET